MRLPHLVAFILLSLLCACNSITGGKESARPKTNPKQQRNDSELRKLRKQQDSLLELRYKNSKKRDLDTLRPVQA